ncbi:MAG: helix-turn-helix domain-containing protein [Spirochaetaceae bacterium]
MIKKGLYYFAVLLFLVSCNQDLDSTIVSNWQVLYSQTENIHEVYSLEEWLDIDIGIPISLPYPQKHTFQYVWLKGSFNTPKDYTKLYGISISKLSMVDRVYINGGLIGYLNEEEVHNLDSSRSYIIPTGIIDKGKNDVYIRAGAYDEWDIEISRSILIQDAEKFRSMRKQNQLLSEFLPFSILTIIVGTFFSFLFKSAYEKWNKEYLILAIRLIIVILCYLTFYSPIPIFSIKTIIAIWKMVLPLFFITMIILYQEIYKIHFEKLNLTIIPFLAGISTVVFFLSINNIYEGISHLLVGLAIIVALMFIFYIFKKILKNRQNDYKFTLVLFDSVIITFNIIIVAMFLLFNITVIDPSLLSIFSSLFLTILFSIYFAKRDGLQKLKMENLSIRLNKSETKSENVQKYNISPSLENKLEKIILFIRENYTFSISREDLAETVGVNPNYLSSLFNIYTGKRINEYINDIRLKRASELLTLQNDSVTDVAFSSGFESLTTFNRLFKKKFDCTPKDYSNRLESIKK